MEKVKKKRKKKMRGRGMSLLTHLRVSRTRSHPSVFTEEAVQGGLAYLAISLGVTIPHITPV